MTFQVITFWLAIANAAAFAAFGLDKRFAQNGSWRISERTLLWLAFVGGSGGAVAAQHFFRHKTRKEPFRSSLHVIVFLQVVGIVGIGVWLVRPDLVAALLPEA